MPQQSRHPSPKRLVLILFAALLLLLLIVTARVQKGNSTQKEQPGAAIQPPGAESATAPTATQPSAPAPSPAPAQPAQSALAEDGPFTILTHTPERIELSFTLPDYVISDSERTADGPWQHLAAAGADNLQRRGAPSLPVYRTDIAIPEGSEVTLELTECQYSFIPDCRPEPSDGPRWRREPETPAPAAPSSVYDGSALYPESSAAVAARYILRETEGCGIAVSPFQFDPVRGGLKVLTSARIAMRCTGASSTAQLPADAEFAAIARAQFLNAPLLPRTPDRRVGVIQFIVPDDWADDLDELVQWKRALGFSVHVARYPSDTGADASDILSYLQGQFNGAAFTHLVLIGDYHALPPYQRMGTYEGKGAFDLNVLYPELMHQYCASDVPYACLAGEDVYQDALLSRIPAGSAESLARIITKLKTSEAGTYAADSWRQSAVFMGSHNKSRELPYAGQTDNDIMAAQAAALTDTFPAQITIYPKSSFDLHLDELSEALNGGANLLMYLGHGLCHQFKTSEFDSAAAAALANREMLPFIISPVCYTGNLDHGEANDNSECGSTLPNLTQALFEAENGGSTAVIASTDATFWEPPIKQIFSFTELLGQKDDDSLRLLSQGAYAAASLNAAVNFCETYYADYSVDTYTAHHAWFEGKEMHFYGDASAAPRFGALRELSVSLTYQNKTTLKVTVTDADSGLPAAGAAVCLQTGNDTYLSERTGSNGRAIFDFSGAELSEMPLKVLDPGAPLIQKTVFRITDLDADGNGMISNLELLNWLKNNTVPELQDVAIEIWQNQPDFNQPSAPARNSSAAVAAASVAPAAGRVSIRLTDGVLARCAQKGLTLSWRNDHTAVFEVTEAELRWLEDNRIAFDIVPDSPSARSRAEVYPSYEEVIAEIDDLATRHWPVIRPSFVGLSTENRRIQALRIALEEGPETPGRPQLLITGSIHGDEKPATTVVMELLRLVDDALSGTDTSAEAQSLISALRQCTLWVMPLPNPDGYAANTRENAAGFDLNRGFPDGVLLDDLGTLGAGDRLRVNEMQYIGSTVAPVPAPLQPEQTALMRWLAARRISSALHFHSGSLLICYPYGNNETATPVYEPTPEDGLYVELARGYARSCTEFADNSDFVKNSAAWYPVVGELADWEYRFLGTLAFTVELNEAEKSPASTSRVQAIWAAHRPAILNWMEQAAGGISGIVTAADTGAPIPYAKITAVSAAGGTHCFYADAAGNYHHPLPPQAPEYQSIAFEHDGFAAGSGSALSPDGTPAPLVNAADNHYLPGRDNAFTLTAAGLETSAADALIVRLNLPSDWHAAAESARAFRSSPGGNAVDALYLREGTWAPFSFGLTPPDNAEEEGSCRTTIYTANNSPEIAAVNLIPPAADRAMLACSERATLASLPIAVNRIPEELALFNFVNGRLAPASRITPGQGYLFAAAGAERSVTFDGWRPDPGSLTLAPGWHCVAPTHPHPALEMHHYRLDGCFKINTGGWESGSAYMLFLPETTTITP